MEMIFPYKEIKWNLTLVLAYDNVIQGTEKRFPDLQECPRYFIKCY